MTASASERLAGCNPLILVGHLTPGGSERQVYLLARGLSVMTGLRPGVVAWTRTNDDLYAKLLDDAGIPLASPPQRGGRLAKLRWLRAVVGAVRPEVLHSYSFYLNAAAQLAMWGHHGVAIGSIRGDYAVEASNGALYYAMNRCFPHTLIANSVRARSAAVADRSMFRPRHTLFVSNGVDEMLYTLRAHRICLAPRLLGIGNLYPIKRWDRVIIAAAQLRDTEPSLAFSIDIVGEGNDRGRLTQLIERVGLTERIVLLGRRYDIPELLSGADALVLASESEGTPNAVMEAMMSGLPIVATDVGDVSRLMQHGEHGLLVSPKDDGALVTAFATIIRDHDSRSRMGASAFRKARAEFGVKHLVTGTLAAYRDAGWNGCPSRPGAMTAC